MSFLRLTFQPYMQRGDDLAMYGVHLVCRIYSAEYGQFKCRAQSLSFFVVFFFSLQSSQPAKTLSLAAILAMNALFVYQPIIGKILRS